MVGTNVSVPNEAGQLGGREESRVHEGVRGSFRKLLAGERAVYPVSVHDPMSARIAHTLGHEVGIMGGSLVSAVLLAAPDVTLITLTELAEHVRRTTQAAPMSLLVDADHGYGNAINCMRTVQELEYAGAAAMTLEDTVLPRVFRQGRKLELISTEEMVSKLRAAAAARRDPAFALVGRTSALQACGEDEAMERIRCYVKCGIDALMVLGAKDYAQMKRIHDVAGLPLVIGYVPPACDNLEKLAQCGVRIALRGHFSFFVALQSLYETMGHLKAGQSPDELKPLMASAEVRRLIFRDDEYERWQEEFLG